MRRARTGWRASSLSVLVAVQLFGSQSHAQFREIDATATETLTDPSLTLTREQFVPPKASTPAKPIHDPPRLPQGEPTPADPLKAVKGSARRVAPQTITEVTPAKKEAAQPIANVEPPVAGAPPDPFEAFELPEAKTPADADSELVVSPVKFRGIVLGKTTVAELRNICGSPTKTVEIDGVEKLIFAMPGFRQIDVLTNGTELDDAALTVESVIVHLAEPREAEGVLEKLPLTGIIPVDITDEVGAVLGVGYPERGVLLGFSDPNSRLVSTVSLEPIRGELFRLRAEEDRTNKYTRSLADLDRAFELDSSDAHALWLKSELLSEVGRIEAAFQCATDAVSHVPEGLYRLTKARLLGEQGKLPQAIRETRAVIADNATASAVKARAEYQLGNLLASGAEADFEKAMASHLKAIDLAAAEMHSENVKVRRMAKDILVESHLSVAQDIAMGNFQRQSEVVPKWLVRATELADSYIETDRGDETLRMDVYRATLATYSILTGNFDASVAAEEALEEGKRIITAAEDPVFEQRVRRQLIETLFYAAKIEHQRGRVDNAMTYALNATALIGMDPTEQTGLFDKYVAGQVYFLVGSLSAIQKKDHNEAVNWYQKARTILESDELKQIVDTNGFGEFFVSMGVSFWEIGQHDESLELTQRGTTLIQDAVQQGRLPLESLSVAYGNLASMHRQIGNKDKAKHFSEMLAKVEKDSRSVKR